MVGLKVEDLKSWKRLACVFAVFGGVQFIILTFIAMIFYPDGYSFANNYLSHLGTTKTVESGAPNTIPRVLFVIACVVAGAVLVPFWVVITTLFVESSLMKYISIFGSILGVISSPFLMALGIFAGDTDLYLHSITTKLFFLLFAAAILIYSIAILLNSEYQNIYSIVGIAFSIIIILYIFRYFILFRVIMQKIIVYGFILWALLQVTKIWKEVGP
jgi:hypothetical membrane protein